VQAQLQESVYWDAYLDTIEMTVRAFLKTLADHELAALWLQTTQGTDWIFDQDDTDDRPTLFNEDTNCGEMQTAGGGEWIPVIVDDVVAFLSQEVLNKAANWTNARIRQSIENSYMGD
jgi:hypothetical protein